MSTRSPVRGLTSLREVPDGILIFIDSNIFTYFLLGGSQHFEACKDLLKRVEKGDIQGSINEIVVAETWYNYLKYRIIKENGLSLVSLPHSFLADALAGGETLPQMGQSVETVKEGFVRGAEAAATRRMGRLPSTQSGVHGDRGRERLVRAGVSSPSRPGRLEISRDAVQEAATGRLACSPSGS